MRSNGWAAKLPLQFTLYLPLCFDKACCLKSPSKSPSNEVLPYRMVAIGLSLILDNNYRFWRDNFERSFGLLAGMLIPPFVVSTLKSAGASMSFNSGHHVLM